MNILEMIETAIAWYFNLIVHPWLVSVAVIALFALITTIITTVKGDEDARTNYLLALALVAAWPITLPLLIINIMMGIRKSRI